MGGLRKQFPEKKKSLVLDLGKYRYDWYDGPQKKFNKNSSYVKNYPQKNFIQQETQQKTSPPKKEKKS